MASVTFVISQIPLSGTPQTFLFAGTRRVVGVVLRTLDALQLAVALDLRRLGQIDVLVAADQRLCRVASMAGCSVVNPEKPGPVFA